MGHGHAAASGPLQAFCRARHRTRWRRSAAARTRETGYLL